MEAFTTFKAIAIPIDLINCDTDQIIPARFLRFQPERDGFHRFLFHDLRFTEGGAERPDFIYNKEPFRDGGVIVADINWGCGSSRENAVYVLVANRIRTVIAPSFGDIHYSNCMKNGVLPVRLARDVCDRMRAQLHARPGAEIAIDLGAQTVTGPDGTVFDFEISPFDKHRMLNGLDDIEMTLQYEDRINEFEHARRTDFGWLE